MRIWGDIFEYTEVFTTVISVADLNGNTYSLDETVAPAEDITFIINSELNGASYVDVIAIPVANLPQAFLVGSHIQTICKNSIVSEPEIENMQYVETSQWETFTAPPIPFSFPFQATTDTVFRFAYANNICGYQYINVFITTIDTLPVSGISIEPFPDISNVCAGCYFPLPQALDLKVNKGTIIASSISWDMPDSTALTNVTRYGKVTVTIRGDSNICGYKTKTIKDTVVSVKVKTVDCDPKIEFDDSPSCYCEVWNFMVVRPNPRCIYTESDITKNITPTIHFDTASEGSYTLKILDSFSVSLTVNAELQCPDGASHATVPKIISSSCDVKVDDSKCPFPVEYSYCRGDSGFIRFRDIDYKKREIRKVTFFPPHENSFIYDTFRSGREENTVYRTIDTIITPDKWDTVRYRVEYYAPDCDTTRYYDSIVSLEWGLSCSPSISISNYYYVCTGDPAIVEISEANCAIIIDSVYIKDSTGYTISLVDSFPITYTANDFGSHYVYDHSLFLRYKITAYTKSDGGDEHFDIPIIVYYRDFGDTVSGTVTSEKILHFSIISCPPTVQFFYPPYGCVGDEILFTVVFENPTTQIDSIDINFDGTSPITPVKPDDPPYSTQYPPYTYYYFSTISFLDSTLYKVNIKYNEGDSLKYKTFSHVYRLNANCSPSITTSKDTVCLGDNISVTVQNNNPNAEIDHVVWSEPVDLVDENLYTTTIGDYPYIVYDVYLKLKTIKDEDTVISYRDTLNIILYSTRQRAFISDTIYICQNSTVNLHDYENASIFSAPLIYALASDPVSYLASDPANIGVTASSKFHCDWMFGSTNMFEDSVFIFIDKIFSIAPIDDVFACKDSVMPLSIASNGRLVTWIKNETDTLAKNIPRQQIIYDTVTEAGATYTVICSNSCNSFFQKFSLHSYPNPSVFMPDAIEICEGNMVNISPVSCIDCEQYLWTVNSQTYSEQEISLFVQGQDTITAFLAVSNEYGCVKNDFVKIIPLMSAITSILLNGDTLSVCLNSDTSFSATFSILPEFESEVIYGWTVPPSSLISISDRDINIHNADTSLQGKYIFNTSFRNCTSSDTIVVSILPLPKAHISGQNFVCLGDTVFLSGSSANADYLQWQNGSRNATLPVFEAGTYFLTTFLNGCTNTDFFNVLSRQKPVFSIGEDTTICYKDVITLTAPEQYKNFYWQDGSTSQTYAASQAGLYTLTVEQDSCYNTSSIRIEVMGCGLLRFPTAFTPDGNSLNDYFLPIVTIEPNNLIYELIIYNRLGERVFSTTNPLEGWDGTFRGKPCNGGIYLYRCTASSIYPYQDLSQSGSVTLVK
jgi:gliding motility-associated-like protein